MPRINCVCLILLCLNFQILKYGSYIVDALSACTAPVFVYLPPFGELRGGSWVVLDPTINPSGCIEMMADPTSRAGILEPAGIVEIKYRRPALVATMMRLDDKLRELNASLKTSADRSAIKAQIDARVEQLLPVYGQIATQFAELHDTPGRMKAKGTISEIVPWKDSRRYFATRLRLRLTTADLANRLITSAPGLSLQEAKNLVDQWIEESKVQSKRGENATSIWAEDTEALNWIQSEQGKSTLNHRISENAKSAMKNKLKELASLNPSLFEETVKSLLS